MTALRLPFRLPSSVGALPLSGPVLLVGVLLLAGCDAGEVPAGPSPSSSASVRVSASFTSAAADMHGTQAAFEAAESVRVRLLRSRDETTVVDRVVDFDPSATTTEISLRVSLDRESEDFLLDLQLLTGGDAVFRGQDLLTLEAGRTTEANVTLEPVPDQLALPVELPVLTALGETLQLDGAVLFVTGDTIPDASPSWSSLDPEVATASANGEVVAQGEGQARIVAAYEVLADTLIVTVEQLVADVVVEPDFASIEVGEVFQFEARVEDANGNELSGRTVTWSSTNADVATVDQTGLARGEADGSAGIRAEVEGVIGSATLRVTGQIVEGVTPP